MLGFRFTDEKCSFFYLLSSSPHISCYAEFEVIIISLCSLLFSSISLAISLSGLITFFKGASFWFCGVLLSSFSMSLTPTGLFLMYWCDLEIDWMWGTGLHFYSEVSIVSIRWMPVFNSWSARSWMQLGGSCRVYFWIAGWPWGPGFGICCW